MKLKRWIVTLGAATAAFAAQAAVSVEVFKSPYCGCCGYWVQYMRQSGFDVKVQDVADVSVVRKQLGMPQSLAACHTAKVEGYVIEGHVPAEDVKRLLAEKPRALGIAVPSMPPGSPGMPSDKPVHFDTLMVMNDGSYKLFSHH